MRINEANQVKPKPLAITLPSGIINVTYSRAEYTPEFERTLKAYMDKKLPGTYLRDMLVKIVKSWDLTQDANPGDEANGVPVQERVQAELPIDTATLDKYVSIDVQSVIALAIAKAERPNDETLPNSEEQF